MLRSPYHTRAQYFYEFHSIHGFGLVWKEKLFKADREGGGGEVQRKYSLTQLFFFVSLREVNVKIDTKTAA